MVNPLPRPLFRLLFRALLLGLGWLLAGCTPYVRGEQASIQQEVVVEPGNTIGQTFVSAYAGLEGVQLYVQSAPDQAGEIVLHLRTSPASGTDLAAASLPLNSLLLPGPATLNFPPQAGSQQATYYAIIENSSEAAVTFASAGPETYLDGALYRDHKPQQAQLTFRLHYNPARLALGLARQVLSWTGWLLAGAFAFLLPGWALAAGLWAGWLRLSWPEKLGLAGGLSLALYPLLLLWLDLGGLALGPLTAWLPGGLGVIYLAWKSLRWKPAPTLPEALEHPDEDDGSKRSGRLPDLVLVCALALIFGVRLWMIRMVDVPMWGDSVQHTVMAQLILDHGGLFRSWEPYAPYTSLSVQWGFSAASAVLAWLTKAPTTTATLIAGQLVNGLAAAGLYPLALKASGSRWASASAVILAGLLSPLPAMYVNWGRYAQLAGQAVLPAVLWLAWEVLTPPAGRTSPRARFRFDGSLVLLGGIALAGMLLTYYRMAFHFAAFVLAVLLFQVLPGWLRDGRRWRDQVPGTVLLGFTGLVLFFPWIGRLAGTRLVTYLGRGVSAGSPFEKLRSDFSAWQVWTNYIPPALAGLAVLALGYSLVKRKWSVALFSVWGLVLVLYPAGALVRLPGANTLQPFSVLISLYIPTAVLAGWLVGEAIRAAARRRVWVYQLVAAALVAASLWGALDLRAIAQPSTYAYVTRPDLQGMAWIEANTSPEALFLVAGTRGTVAVVGEDAGWWLPLLAHRRNTLPPQYALVNEAPAVPEYSRRVVDLVEGLKAASPASPEGMRLLCEWGITHVYAGQRLGSTGYGGQPLYSPDELAASSRFTRLYHRDLVSIFEFDRSLCPASP